MAETQNNICFRNWEYVVLLRVRTLKGLFLFHPINMEQSFKPTDELVQFIKRAARMENTPQRDTETLREKTRFR